MPSTVSTAILRRPVSRRCKRASSARIPPSPSLSARVTNATYLTVTMSVIVHSTIEITP